MAPVDSLPVMAAMEVCSLSHLSVLHLVCNCIICENVAYTRVSNPSRYVSLSQAPPPQILLLPLRRTHSRTRAQTLTLAAAFHRIMMLTRFLPLQAASLQTTTTDFPAVGVAVALLAGRVLVMKTRGSARAVVRARFSLAAFSALLAVRWP